MKGLFRLDGAVQSKQQQHLRCSLDWERLSALTGTRCRQPVWRCPSEQERKELLITLLTTGGRHTQGFLWGHSASAYGHWVCQQGPQDRLGIWLSPLVLIGFTVITVRWACDITPKPISTTPTIPRIWDINKQGKDVGRGGYSSLSCFFFLLLVTNRFVYLLWHSIFPHKQNYEERPGTDYNHGWQFVLKVHCEGFRGMYL